MATVLAGMYTKGRPSFDPIPCGTWPCDFRWKLPGLCL